MKFLKSVSCDFRNFLYVNEKIYKTPLIPAVLWRSLEKTDIVLWYLILKRLRIDFTISTVEEGAHTVVAEFDSETHSISMQAFISKEDTHHNLIFQVIQAAMHEYIHASQYSCNEESYNNFDVPVDYQSYLEEWREVQAFSHCAFLEIMEYTDRPTRTVEQYQETAHKTKKHFWKFIFRWANKYGTNLLLKK